MIRSQEVPSPKSASPGGMVRLTDILGKVKAYHASAEQVHLDAWDARRRAGAGASLNFILRPGHPDLANGAETALAALKLQQQGLGELPNDAFTHPSALVNLVHATLAHADTPLDPAQQEALYQAGLRALQDDEARRGRYTEDTFALARKLPAA